MITSCFLISLMAGIGRHLSQSDIHPFQIVFCRLIFAWFAILPFILRRGIQSIKTSQIKIYFLRSVVSMLAMWTWFFGVSYISIGELTALSFLAPLFATIGAIFFLKETVKYRRWIAIIIGFCGALIIIRPGFFDVTFGHLFAISTAFFMGFSALIIKKLTFKDDPLKIIFISHSLMLPLGFIPSIFYWKWPILETWSFLILIGPLAALAHFTLTKAFSLADASLVTSIDYARLPFAVLIGWIFFYEFIDFWTWIGASIIFISSIYILKREIELKRKLEISNLKN